MDLEKETRRPRLRAARMLFGVMAVSSSAGAATHYALCDREGAPACGNIGQLGRDAPPPAPTVPTVIEPQPITNTTVTHNAPLIAITISTQLVAPPPTPAPKVTVDPGDPLGPEFIEPTVVKRPLVDEAGDPAPGNVIHGKGGRRH
jgi:hypothetical protein